MLLGGPDGLVVTIKKTPLFEDKRVLTRTLPPVTNNHYLECMMGLEGPDDQYMDDGGF